MCLKGIQVAYKSLSTVGRRLALDRGTSFEQIFWVSSSISELGGAASLQSASWAKASCSKGIESTAFMGSKIFEPSAGRVINPTAVSGEIATIGGTREGKNWRKTLLPGAFSIPRERDVRRSGFFLPT
jgi:hypothetical protein